MRLIFVGFSTGMVGLRRSKSARSGPSHRCKIFIVWAFNSLDPQGACLMAFESAGTVGRLWMRARSWPTGAV